MAHIHEHIDFTSIAYIVFKNKVLLIHHKEHNKWLPIGGHIELDEDPEEALFREVKEECGLEVEILNTKPAIKHSNGKFLYAPNYIERHWITKTHEHIGLIYFLRAKSDKAVLEHQFHNEIKWFDEIELADPKYNLQNEIVFYSKEAIRKANTI